MNIFKLFGSIFVNSDEAEKSISKTEKKAESFSSKLGSGIKTAAKWGAGIVAGATIAATAMVGMATKTANTADAIDEMSQKIGISREAYQQLDYICSQNGMTVDSLQNGMKSLTAAMDGAKGGTKSNIEQFEKLGISVTDAKGNLRSQEDVMWETMSALQGMENQTEKARLATELFGKSGTNMMPILNGASGSIEEMKKQAKDLGLVLSDETIDSGAKLADNIEQLKSSFSAIGNKLGASLLPIVQQFVDMLINNMPLIQGMIEKLTPMVSQIMESLLPPLMELAQQLFPIIFDLLKQLQPLFVEIASTILPLIVSVLGILLPPLVQIIQVLLPPLMQIIQAFLPLLTNVITLLANGLATTLQFLTPIIQFVANLLADVLTKAFKDLQPVIDNVKGYFNGLITFFKGVFTGNWKMAFDGLKQIVKNAFEGMVNLAKVPINAIIGLVNGLIKGINSIKLPDAVAKLVGMSSVTIPLIPMLANGGTITKAGRVIVGENAPEILDLPVGARVTPLDKANLNSFNQDDIKINIKQGIIEAIQILGIDKIYDLLIEFLPQLANMQLCMDTGAVVGQIAPEMDIALGEIYKNKERG